MTIADLRMEIAETGADLERLDELTHRFLAELRAFDLPAEPRREEPPPGAKSGAAITAGAVLVAIANSPMAANLVTCVSDWLARRRNRSVRLTWNGVTLELSSASPEERLLFMKWLEDRIRIESRDSR